ncbi:hypothetical protein Daura_42480 [Dactylosporangium aurantiacum]|uniref:Uncharacterized protein n=1 Tax=Dactylosporangium aurantiacum TaxID=35754 RepID=A0A9Q9ICC8_9ACTN|nr:hypothetical protein [Dactylosporangium aurantiacum]MDG6102554.1 hypothetical protein [Dactylosporangium aurantiacum]UWZ53176.1 hypothetical protein Daura_42480 [Dactylosporangium aurantiacum]
MSILLLALAGLLLGGALSLRKQSTSKAPFVITLLLAAVAAAGGLLWL